MQRTDSIFSTIYARKTPTITYKRKQQTYGYTSHRPLSPVTAISTTPFHNTISSTEQHSSLTELTPTSTDDEKENTEMLNVRNVAPENIRQQPSIHTMDLAPTAAKDIFDLPDDDNSDTQVEIRVASSLHSNTKSKNKSTSTNANAKPKHKKTPKIPTKPTPTPTPNLTGAHHQKVKIEQTNTEAPPSFARTLSAPAPTTTAAKTISPSPVARTMSMLPRLPDTKRRKKRNLVSQLKAANGERPDLNTQPGGNRFYDLSSDIDDDADDDIVGNDNDDAFDSFNQNDYVSTERAKLAPPCQSASTPSASSSTTESIACTNNYNDRMEQELANLMRTEFGHDDLVDSPHTTLTPSSSSSSSSKSTQRGCYVPENTIRAPVTYKRLNNGRSLSSTATPSNLPLTGLDHEMEQQIQYLLSGDF